jgi:3-hydroxyisobutyrate dehydrogenase-like beta-hydroxyacid dehydrogenase
MSVPTTDILGFLGFGEAAQALVQGWDRADNTGIAVYDIKTDGPSNEIRASKIAEYQRFGITGCETAAEALRGKAVVFSLVTADQAHIAAQNAAAALAPGALFLDCNSCAPETKRRSAAVIDGAGGRYVDVAVMAPVHPALHKVPLLVSGPHAAAALAAFDALDMNAREEPGEVGRASSIKMIRSIMMKGLEALVLECVLSGRRAGVEDAVLDSLEKSYPGFDWKARSAYMMERVMSHGIRRAAEMREVAKTVADLGFDNGMTEATVDWQQRIGDLHLDAGEDDYKSRADAILAALKSDMTK